MLLGSNKPIPKSAWMALGVLTILGGVLRFYGLERESFWHDELIRVSYAEMPDTSAILETLRGDVHPPGYVFVIHAVRKWWGSAEFHYRFPSAVFGTLVLPLVFLLGCRLFSYREGLAATAITTFFWCPIAFSQEAAPYSMLIFFTVGATLCWLPLLETLRTEGRLRLGLAAGYVALALPTFYLHYYGILFFFLQACAAFVLCIRQPRSLLKLLGMYVLLGAGFLPWLPDFLHQFRHNADSNITNWMKPPKADAFFRFVRFLLNEKEGFVWFTLALLVVTVSCNAPAWNRERKEKGLWKVLAKPETLLALWLLVPFTVVFIVSVTRKPMLQHRYLLISMVPAYLLLARCFFALPLKPMLQAGAAAAAVAVFIGHLFTQIEYYTQPQRQQMREGLASAKALGAGQPGTPLVLFRGHVYAGYYRYYLVPCGFWESPQVWMYEESELPQLLERMRKEQPRRLVLFYTPTGRPSDEFMAAIAAKLPEREQRTFVKANLRVYEAPAP